MSKKIVITTGIFEPDIGGPATYADIIAHDLARDNKVTLITYSSVLSYKKDKDKKYKVVRIWRRAPKPFRQVDYFFSVFWNIAKADIVYTLNPLSAGLATAVACKLLGKKYTLRISGDRVWEYAVNKGKTHFMIQDFQRTRVGLRLGVLRYLQKLVARDAKLNIAHSKYLRELLIGWGVKEGRIKVIYTGVKVSPLKIKKEDARRKIGIPGTIILSVGRLVPWKGFRMLIKLMPKLLEINTFFRLVIVGDGPDIKDLRSMVKNLGLHKKIYILGSKSREELKTYFAAADLFVLNSGYEGISHLILEAMGYGVPVITTAIPGNKELIQQGKNGFMVKYNDEFNLFEAIKTLWNEEKLRESFIEEGHRTYEKFSSERMLRETTEALLE